jgi:hypothetical protein
LLLNREDFTMQMVANMRMNMDTLDAELARLGCGFRECGIHGFIFAPQNSGGLKIEDGCLHFWDVGVNVYLSLESATQKLGSLPNNVGYEKVCNSLLEIEPE